MVDVAETEVFVVLFVVLGFDVFVAVAVGCVLDDLFVFYLVSEIVEKSFLTLLRVVLFLGWELFLCDFRVFDGVGWRCVDFIQRGGVLLGLLVSLDVDAFEDGAKGGEFVG